MHLRALMVGGVLIDKQAAPITEGISDACVYTCRSTQEGRGCLGRGHSLVLPRLEPEGYYNRGDPPLPGNGFAA